MQTTVDASANRRLIRRMLLDLLIVNVLLLPIIICEFAIEPTQRGFFCDDDSIKYPFRANTVAPWMLVPLLGLLPLIVFASVEFLRFSRAPEMRPFLSWQLPSWLLETGKQFYYLAIGILLTMDATELGKFTIGRLRPHFRAVCRPQMEDGTTCADAVNQGRYIEDYFCTMNGEFSALDVRQAHLSFPSGHSSLSFCVMVYLALYLQRRLKQHVSPMTRHFLQFALLMLAWYTALSRVMDYWHHWSDVLVGMFLGIVGGWLTAVYIAKLFDKQQDYDVKMVQMLGQTRASYDSFGRRNIKEELPQLQQQHQEFVVPVLETTPPTPPPYSLNSLHTTESLPSFSNEQYCTKV